MKRLAVDYGKRRAGLAVTDKESNIIMPYKVITYKDSDSFLRQLCDEIKNLLPDEIVLGLPLNMDGTESKMSMEVRGIARRVEEETGVKVVLYDERLTTFEARQMLTEQGISAKRQKEIIDMYSAYCMLRSYVNEQKGCKDD